MTREEITTGLAEILEEVAGVSPDDVSPEKSFTEDLDVDSLSMVEIAVQAEDKFGVKIPTTRCRTSRPWGRHRLHREERRRMSRFYGGHRSARPPCRDVASTWEAMLAGRSGVRALTHPWAGSAGADRRRTGSARLSTCPGEAAARPSEATPRSRPPRPGRRRAGRRRADRERLAVSVGTGSAGRLSRWPRMTS